MSWLLLLWACVLLGQPAHSDTGSSARGVSRELVPVFYFSLNNYDGTVANSPNDEDGWEPDLSDSLRGRSGWTEYLSSRYSDTESVIYAIGRAFDYEGKRAKIQNAVDGARALGWNVYLCFSWGGYSDSVEFQRDVRGRTSVKLPALQDLAAREGLRDYVWEACSLFLPDGVIFDAFRFENEDFGYSNSFIEHFDAFYPSPAGVSWDFKTLSSVTNPEDSLFDEGVYEKWLRFREKAVGSLIEDMAKTANACLENKDIPIGMFVMTPGEHHPREAIRHFAQLDARCLREAGVDFLIPMAYSTSPLLSLYETMALKPFGFELWAGLSVEDRRYPLGKEEFAEMIIGQFGICERVVLYEDNYVDSEEWEVIRRATDLTRPEFSNSPGILFLYTDSDFVELEEDDPPSSYYTLIRVCEERNIPVKIDFLSNVFDQERRIAIEERLFPAVVFVEPGEFTEGEIDMVEALREDGFSLAVFSPNRHLLSFAASRANGSAGSLQVKSDGRGSLGESIASRLGVSVRIGRGENRCRVEGYDGVHPDWDVDLVGDIGGYSLPVVVSKQFLGRREVVAGLRLRFSDSVTIGYEGLVSAIMLWVSGEI